MTVVLNDPATLADLVRFGPVPHDVEAAARKQLPFENKFRALTAYTENRGVWGTDEIRQSRSQRAEVVDPAPSQQVWKHLRAGEAAMDHECEAEDAPAAVEGQTGGVLAPELESLYRPLHATRHILDHLAVTGHRDSGVEQADPLDGGDRRLQSLGTVHEGIDPGHVSGEDGVTRNQDPGALLEEGDLSERVPAGPARPAS